MAEPIEMPFGSLSVVSPLSRGNHVLDGSKCNKRNGQFWGLSTAIEHYWESWTSCSVEITGGLVGFDP